LNSYTVQIDQQRIFQILNNLISNALKFTFKGSIRLSVKMIDEEHISFKVADTGVGISEKDQKNLFTMFSTVHKDR
jgi:signal transduction histidine kinase